MHQARLYLGICENLHQLALVENKKIIPILLDDCMYQLYTEFDDLDILPIQQGTNVPDAIINWQNRKSAYLSVGNAILRQVQSMKNS